MGTARRALLRLRAAGMASAGRVYDRGQERQMTQIAETSKPSLAVGCKWGGTEDDPLVLYPEGAMKVHGTSLAILALCDGQRTFTDIIADLQRQYFGADP